MIKKLSCYEHQKDLAQRYAKAENRLVALYINGLGLWSFVEVGTPEYAAITPVEFISPLQ